VLAEVVFQDLLIECRDARTRQPELRCRNASIAGRLGPLGRQKLRADVSYNTTNGTLKFKVRDLKLAGAAAGIEGHWRAAGWEMSFQADEARLAELAALVKPWFAPPEGYSFEGRISLRANIRGRDSIDHVDVQADLGALTLSNAESTLATDKLDLKVNAQLEPAAQGWRVTATVNSAAGQAYVDPVFTDLSVNPFKATLAGRWLAGSAQLAMDRVDFEQTGVARGSAEGRVDFAGEFLAKDIALKLDALEFPGAYTVLMQPFLLTGDFRDLETGGRIDGAVHILDGAPAALDLTLRDLTAADKQGRLGIDKLRGHVVWQSGGTVAPAETPSHLAWDAANAYGLSGGAARLDFIAAGAGFHLLKPTVLPVLDGGLSVRTLSVQDAGTEQMAVRFEGGLLPISMPRLAQAFGWPEFSGTLSGRIPEISYDGEVLSVGGALEADAFGGRITVNGLELRQPLGDYPRLKADIVLRGLDLEAVTGTFSFGSITGGLDGEVTGLELFRWEPIRMNLRLYTPANDKSKHLISQRAVNNLSSIGGGGGGVAAALQGGLLRFFDNFRYKRLGISCRLENDVCHMNGVAPTNAGNSYYIVQGSGIPRIDIIGNAREVDWSRLVGQLKAMQESGGPVVQ
jgi:autotransporter translocation and assembly factor TamB